VKSIKLSKVISKLEEKGLHKTAENVRKVVEGRTFDKVGYLGELENVGNSLSTLLSEIESEIEFYEEDAGSLPRELQSISDFISKEKVTLFLMKLRMLLKKVKQI